jgi:hypothetical protein
MARVLSTVQSISLEEGAPRSNDKGPLAVQAAQFGQGSC